MIELKVPGMEALRLEHLVLDVNGTLACDGCLMEGVAERLEKLRGIVQLHLITADTHGMQADIDKRLRLKAHCIATDRQAAEKLEFVRGLNPRSVVAIGNGANDSLMLRESALGIAVIGPEGAAVDALMQAKVATAGILQALDLLLNPQRLVATLRR